MPVDRGSLNVQLDSQPAKRELLEADLIQQFQPCPGDHVPIDLHESSILRLTSIC
jgi:hypothetical protein